MLLPSLERADDHCTPVGGSLGRGTLGRGTLGRGTLGRGTLGKPERRAEHVERHPRGPGQPRLDQVV